MRQGAVSVALPMRKGTIKGTIVGARTVPVDSGILVPRFANIPHNLRDWHELRGALSRGRLGGLAPSKITLFGWSRPRRWP